MNPRKRAILRQRGGEIATAGRMFFDAVFGADREAFFQDKGEELEHELAERGVIVLDGELVDDDHPPRRGAGSGRESGSSAAPRRPQQRR
jgi:hypothetical protein